MLSSRQKLATAEKILVNNDPEPPPPRLPVTFLRCSVRAGSFLLKLTWALIVLVGVSVLWLLLLLLFLPLFLIGELPGWKKRLRGADDRDLELAGLDQELTAQTNG